MKTFKDLMNDVKSETFRLRRIERFGEKEICEPAKVIKVQTRNIQIASEDGTNRRWIDFPNASLVEYDGKTLTIYEAGLRDFNDEEKKVWDEWKEIENRPENVKQAYEDSYTDGTTMFYKEKYFFEDKGFKYLLCYADHKGKWYDTNESRGMEYGKIRDSKIKGDVILKYEIISL